MANQRYSEQFKRDAVRLVIEEGYSAKKAGDAVGAADDGDGRHQVARRTS